MITGAKASVRLNFGSQKKLSTILKALAPEATAQVTRRANLELEKDGLFLILTIEADDTVALRATMNAYLRWINSMMKVMQMVEDS
jgi:tRNA threonylcarbamoyladenosine modification (KEOPS) complex  Pcc1 subunit